MKNDVLRLVLGSVALVGCASGWAGEPPAAGAAPGQPPAAAVPAPPELRARLARLVVAKCSFRDAELQEVLSFVKQQAAALDPTGRGFNLFYRCAKDAQTQKVSLDLENVPVTTLLRFVCLAAATPVNFKIEEHAVVITDRGEKVPVNEY